MQLSSGALYAILESLHFGADERGRRSRFDTDVDKFADVMISEGENDDFVLACTAEELVAATFACAFDEHLKRLADVAAVAFGGEFVLESNHTV